MGKRAARLTDEALAEASGVKVEAIRFYEREGLLAGPFRAHGRPEVPRVKFIEAAQRLGFSLAEIGELLRLEREMRCDEARALVERKLAAIRGRNAEIERMVEAITRLAESCHSGREPLSCPLIDALMAGEEPAG
ncbi:MAG: Hg(II)-responsive transcriptional regulator [Rhodocyclaceae bacterium]